MSSTRKETSHRRSSSIDNYHHDFKDKERNDHRHRRREDSLDRHSRKRSRSKSPFKSAKSSHHSKKKKRSSSSSSSSSSSENESDHKKKKKSKKEKKKKEKKSKKKKEKKEKKSNFKSASLTKQWGGRGILQPSDIYSKENEFRTWLIEIKHINTEALNQKQMKDYFSEYMEDFNTCTLAHEKYYDLDKWELEQRRNKSAKSNNVDDNEAGLNISKLDEEALKLQGKKSKLQNIPDFISKSELLELKRVQSERLAAEKLKLLGYTPKETMGVRYEVNNDL